MVYMSARFWSICCLEKLKGLTERNDVYLETIQAVDFNHSLKVSI